MIEIAKLRILEQSLSTVRGTAALVGCSPSQIHFWRRGVVNLKPSQVEALSAYCMARLAALEVLIVPEGRSL